MNRLPLVASLAVAVAIVVGGVLIFSSGNPSVASQPSVSASAAAAPTAASPTSAAVPATIPVTPEAAVSVTEPTSLGSDGQAPWVLTLGGDLARIDPATNDVDPAVRLDGPPYQTDGVSATAGAVWSTRFSPGLAYRVDPTTRKVVARIEMAYGAADAIDVLATPDAVWVSNIHTGTVTRIDPATNKIVATIAVGTTGVNGPHALASGFGSIWTIDLRDYAIIRIDPSTNAVQATVDLRAVAPSAPSGECGGLIATSDAMWTFCDNSAVRIDPLTNKVIGIVDLHGIELGAVVIDGALWVTVDQPNTEAASIMRIDTTTNRVDRVLAPGATFNTRGPNGGGAIVLAAGSVWLADGDNRVLRLPLSAFGS